MNQSASVRQSFSDSDLNSFKSWLILKSYSSSTIRNYLTDINKFFNFYKNSSTKNDPKSIFSPDAVSLYLSSVKTDPNKNRYLSSLSKFFQFAIDQKIISLNPLKKAQKTIIPTPSDILVQYQSFLSQRHFSSATIKNYINDIQQFIDWNQNNPNPPSPNNLGDASLKKGGLISKLSSPSLMGEAPPLRGRGV